MSRQPYHLARLNCGPRTSLWVLRYDVYIIVTLVSSFPSGTYPSASRGSSGLTPPQYRPRMSDPLPIPEEWPEYSVDPQGGDPLTQDLTSPYDKGDLCWILVCTILCWQISTSKAKIDRIYVANDC